VTEPLSTAYLLDRAAWCYEAAGAPLEAARCHFAAGAYRQAADRFSRLGLPELAAKAYHAAGMVTEAAWTLVHDAGDVAKARAELDSAYSEQIAPDERLLRDIVLARCGVADGDPPRPILAVLARAQHWLAGSASGPSVRVEEWAVAVAAAMRRFDQVALVYAAAVRGGRLGAADRWRDWSDRRHHPPLVLPADRSA
jgi:hypothetical protein